MGIEAADWLGLRDAVAVVTGVASGIGRGCAYALAEVGCQIAALDINAAGCAETVSEVQRRGGKALAITCDTTDEASVKAARDATLAAFGRVDVLVNNAGILRAGALETIPRTDWDKLIAVNLTGYMLCAQAFGADMLKRGKGALVHIASIAASEPQALSGAYSVTKSGVVMMSRQLAFEWGPRGVRSNVVSPGLVRTALSEAFYQAPGVPEKRAAAIPLKKVATPEDIASVVVLLASKQAAYVTGQEILADGGFSQTLMSHVPRPGFD